MPRLPRGQRADILLAAVVGVLVALSTVWHAGGFRPVHARAYAMMAVGVAALAVRRRAPVLAVTVVGVSTAYYYIGPFPDGAEMLTFAVASYLAAAQGQRIAAYVGTAAGLSVFGWAEFAIGPGRPARFLGVLAWVLVVVIAGEVTRYHRAYLSEARRRLAEAERTREEEALRRATEERLRIARELHDVLAHKISLINVQAGAALHRRDPEQAYAALSAIKDASKETLRELRTTLGVLRQVDEAQPLAPAPSLDHLEDLIAQTRKAGLPVDLTVSGERAPLPSPVDLAAYRIVQEALTNAVRHAGPATATVLVRYDPDRVTVEITDDGRGPAAGEGNGIRGMRERATAVGGTLTATGRPGGGFLIHATLPLAPP
ncbi:sensor histidine kinase [Actinoallomurus soli]|uniref:sensor histidine kinase n=1 Tax=Actinoallomurus soli TaxID=2952535 RepID=UPI00209322A5|nr:sensor histidine kinase [Actinoallomurus soli]MCO5973416.1 sensor histidine kinase [Actinoallomurus soli]